MAILPSKQLLLELTLVIAKTGKENAVAAGH